MLAICGKLGVSTTLAELIRLCGTDERGTTLAGLRNAAKAKGLEAVGAKVGVDELIALGTPGVAHLWGDHFVVVEGEGPDEIRVTDPPADPRVVSVAEFVKVYSGFALLITKDKDRLPKRHTKGADLRVDGYTWDFGVVTDEKRLEHTFTCRNAGNEYLVISKMDSTCGCTVASLSQDRIGPQSRVDMKVTFDARGRRGAQNQTVYIHSNDPVVPVVQLRVSGVVESSRIAYSPRSVRFGEARRTQALAREIFLPRSEAHPFEVQKASCDIPFVIPTIIMRSDGSGCVVRLDLHPDGAPLGELKGTVNLYTNYPKDPVIALPVGATIKGDIDVFPEALFLGLVKKGSGAEKTVTLTASGKGSLRIEEIENPLQRVSIALKPKVEGKEYLLTVALSPDAPPGYINGEVITIHTNDPDQPEVKVPVYALIED